MGPVLSNASGHRTHPAGAAPGPTLRRRSLRDNRSDAAAVSVYLIDTMVLLELRRRQRDAGVVAWIAEPGHSLSEPPAFTGRA